MTASAQESDVQVAQPRRPLRIAVLTTGTRHAAGILAALDRHGIKPDLVLLEAPRGGALLDRIRDAWRRRGPRATVAAIVRRLLGLLRPSAEPWRSASFYSSRAREVVTVPSLAGVEARRALSAAQPDLLILGGAPILPADMLEMPRIGTLNAHPGVLPRYRGVDVVAHAVLDRGPIGATVHWVDAGIDTGRAIRVVEVRPDPGDDLARLQLRVERAGGEALAEVVADLAAGEDVPALPVGERFPLRRRLSPADRRRADRTLRSAS